MLAGIRREPSPHLDHQATLADYHKADLHRSRPPPKRVSAVVDGFALFLASELVRKGPDHPRDSFGPSFRPNRQSSNRDVDVFGTDRNFGQPGLDLTGALDTSSEAALDVNIRNQTQN